MKPCEEFAPLLSAYFDGELTEEERVRVLAHLKECPACAASLEELAAMSEGLRALEEEEAPTGFSDGVMAAVRAEKSAARRRTGRNGLRRWLALAACVAIAVFAVRSYGGPAESGGAAAGNETAVLAEPGGGQMLLSTAAAPESAADEEEYEQELPQEFCAQVQYRAVERETAEGMDGSERAKLDMQSVVTDGCAVQEWTECLPDASEKPVVLYQREGDADDGLARRYIEENAVCAADGGDNGTGSGLPRCLPVSALRTLPDGLYLNEEDAARVAQLDDGAVIPVCDEEGYALLCDEEKN